MLGSWRNVTVNQDKVRCLKMNNTVKQLALKLPIEMAVYLNLDVEKYCQPFMHIYCLCLQGRRLFHPGDESSRFL